MYIYPEIKNIIMAKQNSQKFMVQRNMLVNKQKIFDKIMRTIIFAKFIE